MTDKVLEAVREASISIACLMDDCDFVQINAPLKVVLEKDITYPRSTNYHRELP